MMAAVLLGSLAAYIVGWLVAIWQLGRAMGPVPVPGRFRRDLREAMLWPCWLLLHVLFWLLARRRQSCERELARDRAIGD